MRRTLVLILPLAFALAACRPDAPGNIDPVATYDAFGIAISPEGVVPVQAVLAEPTHYVGRNVKVEGTVTGAFEPGTCSFSLRATGTPIRVTLMDSTGATCRFEVPADLDGRRAVIQGKLTEIPPSASAGSTPALQLSAGGILVEKSRHDS